MDTVGPSMVTVLYPEGYLDGVEAWGIQMPIIFLKAFQMTDVAIVGDNDAFSSVQPSSVTLERFGDS